MQPRAHGKFWQAYGLGSVTGKAVAERVPHGPGAAAPAGKPLDDDGGPRPTAQKLNLNPALTLRPPIGASRRTVAMVLAL